jgi:hypothetical protein
MANEKKHDSGRPREPVGSTEDAPESHRECPCFLFFKNQGAVR